MFLFDSIDKCILYFSLSHFCFLNLSMISFNILKYDSFLTSKLEHDG